MNKYATSHGSHDASINILLNMITTVTRMIHVIYTVSIQIHVPSNRFIPLLGYAPLHALTRAHDLSSAQVHNTSITQGCIRSFRFKCSAQRGPVVGNGADDRLLKAHKLGARGEDKAIFRDRGLAKQFLDRALHGVNGDGDVGICAGLVVGKLDGGSGSPG